ncbi:hypothetical protein [Halomonas sp. SpR8]|uniref:hypothetical protein n=1 Tax=Halomonas sp. SpR8 TaxID=3050463 RepID=UPI0027E40127|nr:hypothetical protein [Halomonas sp. SpR8]MDQ7729693.1 hypothetical protein [Halomonas sp. SpR8]
MTGFLQNWGAILAVSVMLLLTGWAGAHAEPLRATGTVEITADGTKTIYETVSVNVGDDAYYRSSTYISSSLYLADEPDKLEYAIAITGYENPQAAENLDALIPVVADRLITVFAFIDAEGQQTRGAEITWESDPEGSFYWGSDGMSEDVKLELESYDIDSETGTFTARFSGIICRVTLPTIELDSENCKHVSLQVASELSELY